MEVLGKLKIIPTLKPDINNDVLKGIADMIETHYETIGGDIDQLIIQYAKSNDLLLSKQELYNAEMKEAYKEHNQRVQSINNDPKMSRMAKDLALRRIQDI